MPVRACVRAWGAGAAPVLGAVLVAHNALPNTQGRGGAPNSPRSTETATHLAQLTQPLVDRCWPAPRDRPNRL
eukprot:COSAG01_NODE_48482_length_381_cov_0.446809_1_plen_72_part_10